MAPSTSIDAEVLRAPGHALCATSLAALATASPFQRSNTAGSSSSNGSDDPKSEITKAARQRSALSLKPSSESGKSTDEGEHSDSYEDTSIEYLSADLSGDGAGTDIDSVLSSPRAANASETASRKFYPILAIYPLSLLLQLRAAICRDSADSSAIGYSTRRASTCSGEEEYHSAGEAPAAGSKARRQPAAISMPPAASENAWAARQGGPSGMQNDNEQITRAARSILNKLTVEKFDALSEQLAMCGVRTPEHVEILMHEIFEKAVAQHNFLAMYADLCVKLESDPRIVLTVEAAGQPNSFKHLLLNQCQTAFEQQLNDRAGEGCNAEDEERRIIEKRQKLGNIKFVGHLIVRGMLSSSLLCDCAEKLLRGQTTSPLAFESLAAFLTIVGPKFDTPSWCHIQRLEAIFVCIEDIVNDKSVPMRLRFLFRDVLDLRSAGHAACPMHVNEVRAAAGEIPVVEKTAGQKTNTCHISSRAAKCPLKPTKKFIPTEFPRPPRRLVVKEAPQQARECGSRTAGTHRCAANASHIAAAADITTNRNEKHAAVKAEAASKPTQVTSAATPALQIPTNAPVFISSNSIEPESPATLPAPHHAAPFNHVTYRREVSATLRELSSTRNVAAAVRRIRAQKVPLELQEKEFADLLTRASEEAQGITRRTFFAFCAGLVAGGTFGSTECLSGLGMYFKEIYPDLCEEVGKLPTIVMAELLPTLRTVLDQESLAPLVPRELRRAMQAVRTSP